MTNPLIEPSPVQKMRLKYNLTARELGEESELSSATIYKMEHGELPLSEEFKSTLSFMTGLDTNHIEHMQTKWVDFYRRLSERPDLTRIPVKTIRDKEYVRDFHHYVDTAHKNKDLPYERFILSTFTSYARCARIMKVNPSSITPGIRGLPSAFPDSLFHALTVAGFGITAESLLRNY